MFRFPRSAAALYLALALPAAAQQPPTLQPIIVQNPWARATAGAATTGAAYLTLSATAPNRLVAATSPIAERVEIHEVINDGGVMRMRAVVGIAITPDKPATLAPGGVHIMLLNLRQPLRQGESFPLTLTFAEGPAMTVQVPIQGVGAMGSGHQSHSGPRH